MDVSKLGFLDFQGTQASRYDVAQSLVEPSHSPERGGCGNPSIDDLNLSALTLGTDDLSPDDAWPPHWLKAEDKDGLKSHSQLDSCVNDGPSRPADGDAHRDFASRKSDSVSRSNQDSAGVDYQKSQQKNSDESLPPYACGYCGIHNPASVVECLHPNCRKWFCNSRQQKDQGSHIIQHLVIARHRRVRLHKLSPLGEAILDCYHCDSDNVFNLGFVPAKSDTLALLLCRSCVAPVSQKVPNWDVHQWLPLISDRMFLPWLVKPPSEKEIESSMKVVLRQIKAIEELWSEDCPKATINDIGKSHRHPNPKPAPLKYENGRQFFDVFSPLVRIEAEHDKKLKESQTQENVKIRWEIGPNQKRLAYFHLPNLEQGDTRLAIGDELKIKYQGELVKGKWEAVGSVIKVPNNLSDEVVLELKKGEKKNFDITTNFTVDFVWKSTSFDRMQTALEKFAVEHYYMSPQIHNYILGKETALEEIKVPLPKKLNVFDSLELNHSQLSAVKMVLRKPLSLIQGPPGTGKTVTSAAIVYHLVKMHGGGVLVTAPSNVAVNQLTEKIAQMGLDVVRVTARSREALVSPVYHLSLHEKILKTSNKQLAELMKLKETRDELSALNEKKLRELKREEERKILLAADVICCTCVSAGDARLDNIKFHSILVDEATQATEPECLIPLIRATRQAVLVGDHKQLGPVVLSKKAEKAGLHQSLFERLILLVHRPIRLQVQYRMHPCLSEFPSNVFYEGSLQNGVMTHERQRKYLDFPWPIPESPMLFHCSYGREELSPSGTSYINRTEATYVEKIATFFLKAGIKPSQIGIVTPYEGQRLFISKWMEQRGTSKKDLYKEIETASVDSFQGREMDYIVLTCVRSNNYNGIGFLADPRRLNVALTRAKYGLVILGNPKVLSKHPLWCQLLIHFKEKNCLVEGSLNNLKPALVDLLNHYPRAPVSVLPTTLPILQRYRSRISSKLGDPHLGPNELLDSDGGFKGIGCSSGLKLSPVDSLFTDNEVIGAMKDSIFPLPFVSGLKYTKSTLTGLSQKTRKELLPADILAVLGDGEPAQHQASQSQMMPMSQENYLHLDYKSQLESVAYMSQCYLDPSDFLYKDCSAPKQGDLTSMGYSG